MLPVTETCEFAGTDRRTASHNKENTQQRVRLPVHSASTSSAQKPDLWKPGQVRGVSTSNTEATFKSSQSQVLFELQAVLYNAYHVSDYLGALINIHLLQVARPTVVGTHICGLSF